MGGFFIFKGSVNFHPCSNPQLDSLIQALAD
jgi:hypothetical protein